MEFEVDYYLLFFTKNVIFFPYVYKMKGGDDLSDFYQVFILLGPDGSFKNTELCGFIFLYNLKILTFFSAKFRHGCRGE